MATLSPIRSRRSPYDLSSDFRRMLDSVFSLTQDVDGEEATMPPAVWAPRLDLTETDAAYHLEMDLPGLQKSDITVRMDDHRLLVSGERHEASTQAEEDSIHSERYFGSFYRSVRLPTAVEADHIDAHFENGVLKIDLPKVETSRPKRIEIT